VSTVSLFILLLAAIPIALLFKLLGVMGIPLFIAALIAIIPLAKYIGRATEELALQTSDTVGALLMTTFGNSIELIISILALQRGYLELVRTSIVGSIIANLLLLVGLSMLVGGLKYRQQTFNRAAAGISSTMLIIAVTGLIVPSIFSFGDGINFDKVENLSIIVSIVLALVYLGSLVFTFKTHKHLFDTADEMTAAHIKPVWSTRKAGFILAGSVLLAAVMSEFLVSGIEPVIKTIGVTETFLGAVFIPILTNLAEKTSSLRYALKNKINLPIEIGTSSAIQMALFVVPLLVFVSSSLSTPLTLVFTPFELAALLLAVMITNYLSADGVCNWLEGVQLMAVYAIIAVAFFFV
jgi:Ca2+:H+ antiporter